MNKDTASAFELLGLASKYLTSALQALRYNPDTEFIDAYIDAQNAMDQMAIFLTANITHEKLDLPHSMRDKDDNG